MSHGKGRIIVLFNTLNATWSILILLHPPIPSSLLSVQRRLFRKLLNQPFQIVIPWQGLNILIQNLVFAFLVARFCYGRCSECHFVTKHCKEANIFFPTSVIIEICVQCAIAQPLENSQMSLLVFTFFENKMVVDIQHGKPFHTIVMYITPWVLENI